MKISFLQNVSSGFQEKVRQKVKDFQSSDPFFTLQTSGSTGSPQTVRLSKKAMHASAEATIDYFKIPEKSEALLCLPPDKIGGMMMLVRAWVGNWRLWVTEPEREPLANLERAVDFAAMVPYQVAHSLEHLSKVDQLIIGGAPMSPVLEQDLQNRPVQAFHTYGMSETISHVAVHALNGPLATGVFEALPGVRFAVNEQNCLQINALSIGVSKLQTRDVVELQDETHFRWLGRIDNVVNSAGVKLYPEEVEQKIGTIGMPYFLAGKPDENFGERLIMVVESSQKKSLSDFEAYFHSLSKYERPTEVFAAPQFEYTSNGKLQRTQTLGKLKNKS